MKIRKLISLYREKDGTNNGKYYISFAYYKNEKWNGESERCHLTEEELYNCVKNNLTYRKEKR